MSVVYTGVLICDTMVGMNITNYDKARFWARVGVGKPNSCWYWDNPTHEFGYGWFGINGENKLAHRVAKIIWDGEEKEGMQVLHSCDNPACCNPNHLRWGTQEENIQDCVDRGRKTDPPRNSSLPPVMRGEDNPSSVMSWSKVRDLRRDWSKGEKGRYLSDKYGISISTVYQIVNYRTWKPSNLKEGASV